MTTGQDPLSNALQTLADTAPPDSPAELRIGLRMAFRKHHIQRRRRRAASITAIATCLIVASFLIVRNGMWPGNSAIVAPPDHVATLASTGLPAPSAAVDSLEAHGIVESGSGTYSDQGRFVPLTTFDPNLPVGNLTIVRLEIPGAALRLMGLQTGIADPSQRVLADVLVDEDGTAYAVRLAN